MRRVPCLIDWFIAILLLSFAAGAAMAAGLDRDDNDFPLFDDQPLDEPLSFPDWFKLSFLDLGEDVEEAAEAGKEGIIVYFGQKYCAYCKQFLEDIGKEDIHAYMDERFDVIGTDIHGYRMLTDFAGNELVESQFATREKTNFTPSLVFYDTDGKEALRLRGYYPPYRFRAALE